MTRSYVSVLFFIAAIFVLPDRVAHAQTSEGGVGFRAYFLAESTFMSASQSFDAVLGTSHFGFTGWGGEVTRIPAGLFFRVAATGNVTRAGTRVIAFDGEGTSVGIPIEVGMQHAEFAGGWRFHDAPSARSVPYVGGGFVRLHYTETSDFAAAADNTDETFTGLVIFAGVDVKLWKWLMAGGEVQLRSIPDAIGTAGASQAFNENDLGGVSARVLIGVRR